MNDYTSEIEAYLDERMRPEERQNFELLIGSDPVLRNALEATQKLRSDLAWLAATERVQAANVLRGQMQARHRRQIRLTVIATLVVILAGILTCLYLNKETSSPAIPQPPAPPMAQETLPETNIPSPAPTLEKPPLRRIAQNTNTPPPSDLMRNLPEEMVPDSNFLLFEKSFKTFALPVPEKGTWAKPIEYLRTQRIPEAYLLLKKAPQNDTSTYLLSIAELMLKRPSAAQDLLYPLSNNKQWQREAQYLLIWAYLLEGKTDLVRAALKTLPDGFRDKTTIQNFVEH